MTPELDILLENYRLLSPVMWLSGSPIEAVQTDERR
jgi:hypothetical protein